MTVDPRSDRHRRRARHERHRLEAERLHPLRVQLRGRDRASAPTGTRSTGSVATRPTRPRWGTRARRRSGSTTTRTVAASGSCTRCGGGPTGRSRRSTGTPPSREVAARLGHVRDTYGGGTIVYYGGGGQGNHLGGHVLDGDAQRVRRQVPLQRHRPGEDRRGVGQRADARHAGARRVRALRGGAVRRQEPVAQPRHPPCPHHAQGDRQRPGPLA